MRMLAGCCTLRMYRVYRNAAANVTPGVTRSRLRLTSVVNRTPIGTYSRSMLCSCESSNSSSWILSAGRRDAARRPPKINVELDDTHVALHEKSSCCYCSSWLWLFFVIVIIMIIMCMCVMCWRFFYRSMPHGYFLHLFLLSLLGVLQVNTSHRLLTIVFQHSCSRRFIENTRWWFVLL